MVTAPPFPEAWGFTQLIGENKSNILNASVEAWKNTGREINTTSGLPLRSTEMGMGAALMFGMLPFIVGTMVYVRTKKMIPTTFSMLITTGGLHVFHLVEGSFLKALYIVTVFSFTFSLLYAYWNR